MSETIANPTPLTIDALAKTMNDMAERFDAGSKFYGKCAAVASAPKVEHLEAAMGLCDEIAELASKMKQRLRLLETVQRQIDGK